MVAVTSSRFRTSRVWSLIIPTARWQTATLSRRTAALIASLMSEGRPVLLSVRRAAVFEAVAAISRNVRAA
ncbi:Uncharacterised protein [Mycobacteroides abscessus]|nr:Uncharacterised protein [Mycobacteroides abscessus]